MLNLTEEEIMKNWGVDNSDNPLVTVKTMTYNQEDFIAQTIEGVLKQKTTFPFEFLIHDDASTDNTASVVRQYAEKYPKIIKPIYEEENQYKKGTHHVKIDAAIKGKYLTLCEGDDYWIDDSKLQCQVSYMEKHPDCGATYTFAKAYIQQKGEYEKHLFGKKNQTFRKIMIFGNSVPNLTSCIRVDIYKKLEKELAPVSKNWLMGDLPKWLWITTNSKLVFIPRVTSVYRILKESAAHSQNPDKVKAFEQSAYDIREYFAKLNHKEEYLKKYQAHFDFIEGWQKRDFNMMKKSLKNLPWEDLNLKNCAKFLISCLK